MRQSETLSCHGDSADTTYSVVGDVLERDSPLLGLIIPHGLLEEMLKAAISLHVVFVGHILEILVNLSARRVVSRPTWVIGKGELINVRRDVYSGVIG